MRPTPREAVASYLFDHFVREKDGLSFADFPDLPRRYKEEMYKHASKLIKLAVDEEPRPAYGDIVWAMERAHLGMAVTRLGWSEGKTFDFGANYHQLSNLDKTACDWKVVDDE